MFRSKPVATAYVIFCICIFCLACSLAWSQNNVLTQHNDNARTGLNSNEVLLTPSSVNAKTFGKLFSQSVDGIIVAQPLYASGVLMSDGMVHNVVFVATQNNSVYAFDADNKLGNNASPLWSVSLNDGGTPDPIADYGCTGTHYTQIGIMGTPVINAAKNMLYVVAKTVITTGATPVRQFSLHALDLATGSERLEGPVIITGTAQSSNGSGTFKPIFQMQRPALLLQGGILYIGFGGNGCDEYAYNGWLFAYGSTTLQQEAAFLVTPDGTRGSIWQGGSGPAADDNGNIYVVTANGTYDGPASNNDFGDSVLEMGWNGNVFGVLDYFTPYNQLQLAQQDLDLGSSGALILPEQPGLYPHELIAGGKQGTVYLVNRDNEGHYNPTSDNVIQSIPHAVAGELRGVPSYWNENVYIAGEQDYIKQFAMVDGMLTSEPVSQTTVFFGGAGPESTSISSNDNTNGILWALQHTSSALYAFDPTNLAHVFYNSNQALQSRDKLGPVSRFVTPTIADGRVYVGGTAALWVYGLLPTLSVGTGNNQSGLEKAVLPVPLTVRARDAYTANPLPGVVVKCVDSGQQGVFTPSATQTTDATGTVTFTYQLPPTPRGVTINCTSPGYVSAAFAETAMIGPPARMSIPSGNNQIAAPNTPLPAPLVVKVFDAAGFPVPGVAVNFTDNGAGGTFAATKVVTDSTGKAAASYTTGAKLGKVIITASTAGVKSLNLTATVALP